jgi:hypothetical protein
VTRHASYRNRFRLRLLAGVLLALAVVASPTIPAGATPGYNWPGMKKCGSFKAKKYRIYVYRNKHLKCKKAKRIMRAYWGPRKGTVTHNGGTGAYGWVTLKKYPGWKCYSGAGGGTCRKHKQVAGYQN